MNSSAFMSLATNIEHYGSYPIIRAYNDLISLNSPNKGSGCTCSIFDLDIQNPDRNYRVSAKVVLIICHL